MNIFPYTLPITFIIPIPPPVTPGPQSNQLVHNVSAGVIISNQSLVMQQVARAQAGHYACHARNAVGRGTSNTLTLDVKCRS